MKVALCLIAVLAGCTAAASAPVQKQASRPDGSRIDYAIDWPADATGLVILAQGSGCLPGAANATLATVRAAFPTHVAIIVEKYGVRPDAPIRDGFADCPAEFHAGHTVTQRVSDYAAVIAEVRTETGADLPLVLFGGSEGGLAVAILAARVDADATILLSSGSGLAFADMVLSTVPPEGHATIKAGFAAALAAPQSSELFAGSSYRFWADIMDYRAVDEMLRSDTPFLVIQGGHDRSAPVAAARLAADAYLAAGRCNLTYWELPALDHGMIDPAGNSHLSDILALAAAWTARPMGAC